MGKVISIKDSDNKPIPAWAKFLAFDETEFALCFEEKADAVHHARLNECIVRDLVTDELIIDTLNR